MPNPTDQTPPTAPSGLTASSVTATSVHLNWTGSSDSGGSGLAGYKVYRGLVPVGAVTSTGFDDTSLQAATTYSYTVTAFDNAQNLSTASNTVTFTTTADSVAPAAPSNLLPSYVTATEARLDWTASTDSGGSGLAGYKVYREGALISGSAPSPYGYFDDPSLPADAAYSYYVQAVDYAGNVSSASVTRSIFHDDFNRADSTGLSNSFWSSSGSWNIASNQASMTTRGGVWSDAFDTKSFRSFTASVRITGNPGGGVGIVCWGDVNTEKYRLYLGSDGNVFVAHYNAQGANDFYTFSNIGAAPATLRVDADSPTRSFRFYRNGVQMWNYTDTGTRQNTGKVGITGYLTSTSGGLTLDDLFISETNGFTPDTTPPSTPQNLSVVYTSATATQLTWSASTDAGGSGLAGYRVYREGSLISGSPLTSTSYQDSTLANDSAYTYSVTAVDNAGNESPPAARSVFRDDFNRGDGTGLSNSGWANSGLWNIASGTASLPGPTGWSEALSSKTFGSFKATVSLVNNPVNANAGLVFWNSAAGKYRVIFYNSVLYLISYWTTNWNFVATANSIAGPCAIRVEADSNTRLINIYINDVLTISYTEADPSRTNSGQVGLAGAATAGNSVQFDDFVIQER